MSIYSLDNGKQISYFRHGHICNTSPEQPAPRQYPWGDEIFFIELSEPTYGFCSNTRGITLKLTDGQGHVVREKIFRDIKEFGSSGWVGPDQYLIQTNYKKRIRGIRWLTYEARDAVIADMRTGGTRRVSDIVRRHVR